MNLPESTVGAHEPTDKTTGQSCMPPHDRGQPSVCHIPIVESELSILVYIGSAHQQRQPSLGEVKSGNEPSMHLRSCIEGTSLRRNRLDATLPTRRARQQHKKRRLVAPARVTPTGGEPQQRCSRFRGPQAARWCFVCGAQAMRLQLRPTLPQPPHPHGGPVLSD
jgi:hypothetical protein